MGCHFAAVCEVGRHVTTASQGDCAIQAALRRISAAVAPRRSCYVRLCVKSGRSVTSGRLVECRQRSENSRWPRVLCCKINTAILA
jgi:hypothetical protein